MSLRQRLWSMTEFEPLQQPTSRLPFHQLAHEPRTYSPKRLPKRRLPRKLHQSRRLQGGQCLEPADGLSRNREWKTMFAYGICLRVFANLLFSFFSPEPLLHLNRGPYQVWRCGSCRGRFQWQNRGPELLAELTSDGNANCDGRSCRLTVMLSRRS